MTDSQKPQSKRAETLLTNLFSTKSDTVRQALEKIPEQGDARMVIPLLKTYKAWESELDIREKIAVILGQLKTESAIPELIEALEDPQFDEDRALIISSFWHSGLYPVNDIDLLVKHAIRGDFMVTLEVLTVIENLETIDDMEMLQEVLFDIDDFIDEHPDAPHSELLHELKQVLNTFSNQ